MAVISFTDAPDARALFLRMQPLIAASYALDVVMLQLFVVAGAAPAWLPLLYGALGLSSCGIFYSLIRSGWSKRFSDANMTLTQLTVASALQLACVVIAQPIGLYFITMLYVIFGFASLRLRARQAFAAWLSIGIALSAVVAYCPRVFMLPHARALERALIAASILLALARCIVLGLYGRHLRSRLARRGSAVEASLLQSEQDRARTSAILSEDICQDLAGISLLLSAYAARLHRDGDGTVSELALATARLRQTLEKTLRVAADTTPSAAPPRATDSNAV